MAAGAEVDADVLASSSRPAAGAGVAADVRTSVSRREGVGDPTLSVSSGQGDPWSEGLASKAGGLGGSGGCCQLRAPAVSPDGLAGLAAVIGDANARLALDSVVEALRKQGITGVFRCGANR